MTDFFRVIMEEFITAQKLFSCIFSQIAIGVLTEVNLLLLHFLIVTRSFASDKGKSFVEIVPSRAKLNLDNVSETDKMVKKVGNIFISLKVPCPDCIPAIE